MKTSYELSLTESEIGLLSGIISEFIILSVKRIDDRDTAPLRKLSLETMLVDAKSIAEKLLEATE